MLKLAQSVVWWHCSKGIGCYYWLGYWSMNMYAIISTICCRCRLVCWLIVGQRISELGCVTGVETFMNNDEINDYRFHGKR